MNSPSDGVHAIYTEFYNDVAIQKRWNNLWSKILHLSDLYGSNLVNTDRMHKLVRYTRGRLALYKTYFHVAAFVASIRA
jgi:hypothetical protein